MLRFFLVLMVFSMAFGQHADASFLFVEKEVEAPKPGTHVDLAGDKALVLTQIGSGDPVARESMGEEMSLVRAINVMAPGNWEVQVEDSVKDKRITWASKKGQPWTEVLEQVGKEEEVRFVVNWETMEIAAGKADVSDLVASTQKKYSSEAFGEEKQGIAVSDLVLDKHHARLIEQKAPDGTDYKYHKVYRKAVGGPQETALRQAETEELSARSANDAKGPRSLESGRIQKSLKKWAKAWGYDMVFYGHKDVDLLAITHPLNLDGNSFKDDLAAIAADINSGRDFQFKFVVNQRNNVLDVQVSRK